MAVNNHQGKYIGSQIQGPDNWLLIPRAKEKHFLHGKTLLPMAMSQELCMNPKEMQTEETVVKVRESSSYGGQKQQRSTGRAEGKTKTAPMAQRPNKNQTKSSAQCSGSHL